MQDSVPNRRQTVRLGAGVAFAQIGIIGFDGQIELDVLRLYGMPEDAPAILYGTSTLPLSGQRILAFETSVDFTNLKPRAAHVFEATVAGARQGDLVDASISTSSRFVQVAGHVWTNNTVRVIACNVSGFSIDPTVATLTVQVVKRRVP